MSELSYTFDDSGLEVVITPNGAAYCTQSSYSRWVEIDRTTVVKRCQNFETLEVKDFSESVNYITGSELIKTQINTGNQTNLVVLIPAKIMARWLAKDKPELFDKVMEAGATQFLYRMAGYQLQVVEEKPRSTADMLLMYAQAFKEHEQRLDNIEQENKLLKQQLLEQQELVEAIGMETDANTSELERFRSGHGLYFSIIGYAHKEQLGEISVTRAAALGRKASAMCRQRGIRPEQVTDPRFGLVNTYPASILAELDW